MQASHPGELVGEFVGAHRIAIRQIDVDDADALDEDLEEAGVAVFLVAGEGGADSFEGVTREDGDTVVGLLRDSGAVVAEVFEDIGGEVRAFELLEKKDVGLASFEPRGDVVETGADGVDVPAGDLDVGSCSARAWESLCGVRGG